MNDEKEMLEEEQEELEEDFELDEYEDSADDDDETVDESTEDEVSDESEDEAVSENEAKDSSTESAEEKKEEIPQGNAYKDKHETFVKQARRTLKSLGIPAESDEEVLAALEKLGADSEGKSVEEYRDDTETVEKSDDAKKPVTAAKTVTEDDFARDLATIQAEYPETRAYKNLRELPNVKRFAELMDTGKMTAVEAYRATHPKEIGKTIASSVKQASLDDTKRHLHSSVPKKGADGGVFIPKAEMEMYREMFPDLSDAEIRKKYSKFTK